MLFLTACTGNNSSNVGNENSASSNNSTNQTTEKINVDGYPISNEDIELTIMMKKSPDQKEWDKLWISNHLNEVLGGTIKAIEIDDAAWDEKKNLAFATGELPDIIWSMNALTASDVANYGNQDLLIPLNDLIDQYAPNIKRTLENNPALRKTITSLDGNIYALGAPVYPKREPIMGRYWLNMEWLEKLGLEVPNTLDEFYSVLKAFKEQDPNGNGEADEIPASGSSETNPIDMIVLSALGFLEKGISLDDSGTKVRYTQTDENFKEYLIYMNKLYSEGLLDNEYYTQNITTFRGKAQQERVGFYFDAAHFVAVGLDNYLNYESFAPLTSPQNSTRMWPLQRVATLGGTSSMAITSASENPEAAIRLLDYAFTIEGAQNIRFGPEENTVLENAGVVYNDDGTWDFKLPDGVSSTEYRTQYVTNMNLSVADEFYLTFNEGGESASLTKNLVENVLPYGKPVYPDVFLTDEEQDRVNKIQTDLETYVDQMEAKFIVGDISIDKWDEYIETTKKIGVEELIDIYQTAFDRWNQ